MKRTHVLVELYGTVYYARSYNKEASMSAVFCLISQLIFWQSLYKMTNIYFIEGSDFLATISLNSWHWGLLIYSSLISSISCCSSSFKILEQRVWSIHSKNYEKENIDIPSPYSIASFVCIKLHFKMSTPYFFDSVQIKSKAPWSQGAIYKEVPM